MERRTIFRIVSAVILGALALGGVFLSKEHYRRRMETYGNTPRITSDEELEQALKGNGRFLVQGFLEGEAENSQEEVNKILSRLWTLDFLLSRDRKDLENALQWQPWMYLEIQTGYLEGKAGESSRFKKTNTWTLRPKALKFRSLSIEGTDSINLLDRLKKNRIFYSQGNRWKPPKKTEENAGTLFTSESTVLRVYGIKTPLEGWLDLTVKDGTPEGSALDFIYEREFEENVRALEKSPRGPSMPKLALIAFGAWILVTLLVWFLEDKVFHAF